MKQLGIDPMAGGKREDPDYAQVSGYIPKKLALKFKAACTMRETTQSDALEKAIQVWLEQKESDSDGEVAP
ncbi:MAG: hypothetical protein ACFB0D_01280 [Phormidesmis sp.]